MVRTTLVAVAAGIWLGKAGVDGVAQIWFDGGYLGSSGVLLLGGRTHECRFSVDTIGNLVLGKRNRRKWVREFGFRANDVAYLHPVRCQCIFCLDLHYVAQICCTNVHLWSAFSVC